MEKAKKRKKGWREGKRWRGKENEKIQENRRVSKKKRKENKMMISCEEKKCMNGCGGGKEAEREESE